MSQIVDCLGLDIKGDECRITGFMHQDNIPVLEENYVRKMNSNGWSDRRMFRKIASVPVLAWLKAAQEGYDMGDPKDVMRYLRDNQDYMSVERIKSRNTHNIIVK